jgi:hypothetical protein
VLSSVRQRDKTDRHLRIEDIPSLLALPDPSLRAVLAVLAFGGSISVADERRAARIARLRVAEFRTIVNTPGVVSLRRTETGEIVVNGITLIHHPGHTGPIQARTIRPRREPVKPIGYERTACENARKRIRAAHGDAFGDLVDRYVDALAAKDPSLSGRLDAYQFIERLAQETKLAIVELAINETIERMNDLDNDPNKYILSIIQRADREPPPLPPPPDVDESDF